jgi:phage terminase large subunit-like protein
MDIDQTPQQTKQEALEYLSRTLPGQRKQLEDIDPRLVTYYDGLTDPTLHNLYEILSGIKFLRILRTYSFSHKKVRQAIQLYEGRWQNGQYIDGSGGLQFSGLKGFTHYQLQPFQVYALAGLLGPMKDVDGDTRRLCTELVLYLTRKSGKTLMSAFIQFYGFFFMDSNFEGYCCANSADQAKLLYKTAQTLIRQMDPQERRIRFTASQTNWKPGQPRQASITALSAGGKTKDGLFAQLCCADEFGSADFTNGKSDMLDLVSVVQSSMGPRREPLTVITTTAGYAPNGPFHNQLLLMEEALEIELTLPHDWSEPRPDDYQHALLLQPDQWEQTDEEMLLTDERVWRKSNPMIGISVQPSFYEQEAYKARQNPDNRKEFITKLVNVYQSAMIKDWIKPEEIRAIQIPRRIDDCTEDEGWEVTVGSDFSKGDDLNGNSYLAKRWRDDLQEMEYFADMDSYMSEAAVNDSPIRELLLKWAADGWLHIVPGKTFDPAVAVNRIVELDEKGVNIFAVGYDPYNAKTVINALSQWFYDIGLDPKQYILPVRQNFATYSPAVKEFDYMIHRGIQSPDGKVIPNPMIHLSKNPLWPYEFSCAVLAESTDGMENLKPVKANPGSASCKVDNIQMLLSALLLHDQLDTK